MEISFAQANAFVGSLLWPFMRISAMFLAAPIFGSQLLNVRTRIVLALLVSFLVVPMIGPVPSVEPFSYAGLLISLQQILIGLGMGFILQLVFGALVIAGESIAMTMGLGFASMIDPANGVSVPVVSQFFLIVGTLLFLVLGGHLLLIQLVVSSFESLPITLGEGISRDSFWLIVSWGSQMFIGAAWIALPAVSTLLTLMLAMGVMTRAAPQLNIFSVGFPLTLLLGFVVLMLTLPGMLPRFQQLMLDAMQASQQIGAL